MNLVIQKTDGRGLRNTLTITFVSNVDLSPSSSIVLSNLKETNTESNPSLPVHGNGSSLVGASAAWEKSSGILVFRLELPLLQNTPYVMHIDITNPDGFQIAPDLWVEVLGGDTPFPFKKIVLVNTAISKAPLFISGNLFSFF